MAASPTMWFPLINTLATIDLYCDLRTDNGTNRAARALSLLLPGLFLGKIGGVIPIEIEIVGERNETLGTELDAQHASLAEFLINLNISLHLRSLNEKDKPLT
jgi:hypothetical protein